MGIRALFNATWDQVYRGAVGYGNSDIIPEQRVIIVNRDIKRLIWGQLIMMFDEDGTMSLITSRFCVTPLAISAYLHTLEQVKRLQNAGIVCNVAFEKGLVTCTYSRTGWLERVAQVSSAPPSAPQSPVLQQPTPSGKSTGCSSPKTSNPSKPN